MIDRELLPLALLYAESGEEIQGRTRLQKLVFLTQKEFTRAEDRLPGTYTYVPYDYGPFARDLYDDLDRLKDRKVIVEDPEEMEDGKIKYDYRLGPRADEYLAEIPEERFEAALELAQKIKSRWNSEELPELLDYVYSEYPEYAENSVL